MGCINVQRLTLFFSILFKCIILPLFSINISTMKTIFPFSRLPPAEEIRSLAPLREFEILLIICAIIFLALMLLGIGCSYYCLKRRNIKVVKRRPASTLGSEITKISEPISMFDGLKIPRYVCISAGLPKKQNQSIIIGNFCLN